MRTPFPGSLALPLLVVSTVLSAAAEWRSITTETHAELAANEIQFLEPMEGELWIGTLSGLTRVRDGEFGLVSEVKQEKRRHPETGEWVTKDVTVKAERQITDVLRTAAGAYLVGTAGGMFTMTDMVLRDNALEGRTVSPIVRFNEQTLWLLAENGGKSGGTVMQKTDEGWRPVKAFADHSVVDLVPTPDGHFWLIIDGNGVVEVDPNKGVDEAVHHLEGLNVRSVLRDSKGRVWCGFWGRGVAVHHPDHGWQYHLDEERSAVLIMTEDLAGNVWVGTSSGGLYRFDGEKWRRYFEDGGTVSLLFCDRKGRVWVSSQKLGGLRCWRDGEWHTSLNNRLPMTSMAEYDGALWAGGVLDGIHVLDMQ